MYKINKYPDGQINVSIESEFDSIFKRVNSYEDLFVLKSISEVFKYNRWKMPSVYIPCLFGAQSDRRFNYNESFDLKIICDFINSCEFRAVEILDPHSDVGPALINNCVVIKPDKYIKKAIENINSGFVLISPDAGAYKKVFKFASENNYELVAANKYRDRQGNIELNVSGNVKGRNCLIVDDLILGGKTFLELAKKLKELGAYEVYLYVTHGKFPFGVNDGLFTYIEKIYCTDSVKIVYHKKVCQFTVR